MGMVMAGAVGVLLAEGLNSSLNYFLTVKQAEHQRSTLGTSTFRLEGVLVPGTKRSVPGGVAFELVSGHICQEVVNYGVAPQLFINGIGVVVVGHFTSSVADPIFDSDQIEVKHSATYVAAHPGRVKIPGSTADTCSSTTGLSPS